jgi:putative membrane protein insertion efficiency factor
MGHRDSPAQLGGHDGFFGADQGTSATNSSRTHVLNPASEAPRLTAHGKSAAAWALLLLVRFYITFLSPFFGGACKFHPSCSNYAADAIAHHGAARGLSLALGRLLRCNPFTKGGFDPVPDVVLPPEPAISETVPTAGFHSRFSDGEFPPRESVARSLGEQERMQ